MPYQSKDRHLRQGKVHLYTCLISKVVVCALVTATTRIMNKPANNTPLVTITLGYSIAWFSSRQHLVSLLKMHTHCVQAVYHTKCRKICFTAFHLLNLCTMLKYLLCC